MFPRFSPGRQKSVANNLPGEPPLTVFSNSRMSLEEA